MIKSKKRRWVKALVLTGSVVMAGCVEQRAADAQKPKQEVKSGKGRPKRNFDPTAPDGAPVVGDVAPMLTLKTLDGTKQVDLAKFKGQRPVVLVFGSYT